MVNRVKNKISEEGAHIMIQENIKKLVQYGLQTGLIRQADTIYTTNRLLELFMLDELEEDDCSSGSCTALFIAQ